MASSLGQPWSWWATAGSVALHALTFILAGWVTRGGFQQPSSLTFEHVTRAYAVHYLVPVPQPARPEPRPEGRRASHAAPVAALAIPAPTFTMPTVLDAGVRSEPQRSALQIQELSPGVFAELGRVILRPGSDAAAGRGRPSFRPGPDQVAELVNGASSACPELRRPAGWAGREVAVAVAFVVDTNGKVDPRTLRVIESPNRPRTEHRVHSHIYIVGATMRDDPDRLGRTAYDSLARHDVASHVAGLLFRPALMEGRATRSTVMVSCQTS